MPSRLTACLAVCLALLAAASCAGTAAPSTSGGGARASGTAAIAQDLAEQLKGKAVSCIAVGEALGAAEGSAQRSSFGIYITKEVASELNRLGFRIVHLVEEAKFDEARWLDAISLNKADAVLEGTWLDAGAVFELTMEVRRPMGETYASARGKIPATEGYRKLVQELLPPRKPVRSAKAAGAELKSDIYHARATDPRIQVSLRPVRTPVRVGDKVAFLVKSNTNGYLSLLYNASSGGLDFLVPSEHAPVVTVREGTELLVPGPEMSFDMRAAQPPGWERVKAIVTREPIQWPRDGRRNVPMKTEADLKAVLETLQNAAFGEAKTELETLP